MGQWAPSRFQLIPGPEPCQGSIARGVELAPGAHASARFSVRPPRRAHHRGHCRRAGVPRRRDRPPLPGLLLLLRLPRLSRYALGPHGRPRIRRPDRGRGRPLAHFTDGARRDRAQPHPLRGRARRPALQPRAGAGSRSRGACSSGTSRPTSPCPRSCWRRGSSSSPRTPPPFRTATSSSTCVSGPCPTWRCPRPCWGREVRGHPGELRAAAPVRPRLGLLPHVSGEPRAPGMAGAAPRDPAALPRGACRRHPVSACVFVAVYAAAPGLLVDGWLYRRPLAFSSPSPRCPSPSRSGRSSTRAAAPLAARGPADHRPHARHRPRASGAA